MAEDLFGYVPDPFLSARDRYGVWPTTIWPVASQDPVMQAMKDAIGDFNTAPPKGTSSKMQAQGQAGAQTRALAAGNRRYLKERTTPEVQHRAGAFATSISPAALYRTTVSIFNPAVAMWILNCYAPSEGTVYDPFAGGGTRAIVAAKHGLRYVGVELRAEEVEAVRARVAGVGVADSITLHHGDARRVPQVRSASAQFCYTCPPYWNMEKYDGGAGDLSMMSYGAFCEGLAEVVAETNKVLTTGSLSVWVVGLHRHEDGRLVPIHHDIARLHLAEGHFEMREEIILHHASNGAIQRVGNFDKGQRHLVRVHEYILVFRKVY